MDLSLIAVLAGMMTLFAGVIAFTAGHAEPVYFAIGSAAVLELAAIAVAIGEGRNR